MTGRRRTDPPDIDFTARVRATRLFFTRAPSPHVEFTEDASSESSSGSCRSGLPDSVDEGVTYHDIRVDYRIRGLLD